MQVQWQELKRSNQYRDEYYERNKQKEKEAAGFSYFTNTQSSLEEMKVKEYHHHNNRKSRSRLEKMKEYNKQFHESNSG